MSIKGIVNKLRNKYKTNNPYEIAEKLGIWIYELDLGKNIKGHYMYAKRKKVFFINEKLEFNEKLFCCAHELGHAVLHTKNNIYFNDSKTFFNQVKHEKEADLFAAELLIDDNLLFDYEGYNLDFISKCENIDKKYLELKFNR